MWAVRVVFDLGTGDFYFIFFFFMMMMVERRAAAQASVNMPD